MSATSERTSEYTSEYTSAVRNTVPHFSRIAAYTLFPFALIVSAAAATLPPRGPAKATSAIQRVTIAARDFAFEAPDTMSASFTEFVLNNLGPEMHDIQLLRLEGGHTMSDLMNAMKTGGPHVMKGMSKEFVVRPAASAAAAPAADMKVVLNDYTFAVSKPITAGKHVLAVTNVSRSKHNNRWSALFALHR